MPIDPLLAPIPGADRREIGGVQLEVVRAGASRVKRMIYPVGFRWSTNMKPIVGTDLCAHAHVGFLAKAIDSYSIRRRLRERVCRTRRARDRSRP